MSNPIRTRRYFKFVVSCNALTRNLSACTMNTFIVTSVVHASLVHKRLRKRVNSIVRT